MWQSTESHGSTRLTSWEPRHTFDHITVYPIYLGKHWYITSPFCKGAQIYLVCQTNNSFNTADCDGQTSQLHLITVWNQEHSNPSQPAPPTPIQITAAASSTTTTSRARWLFRSPRVQARREQCGWSLSQYCGTARSCSRQLVAAAQSRGGVQQLRQLSPRQPVSKQRRKVRACSGGYRFARKGLCPMFCQNN